MDLGMIIVGTLRIFGPLLMFKWPLLGALLSEYVFDAFDVVVWDLTKSAGYSNYTPFDKFFDTYQLVIMIIIADKWKNRFARRVAWGLFTIRMVGFVAYEVLTKRIFFFVFPSLLVLYFIGFYLAARLKREDLFSNPKYLWVIMAVLMVLKMPQEYILHFREIPTWSVIKGILGIGL